ncbi:predicted protein [Sclerotinia sclerotiorum 1980 UF-70]|uniref:Uncharacterized protein n=1 Tax=Sclerotinia sclerotiorum (strain ATCC 18683 / 1980 / Ss-1) TaxID=665079 RepID=A7F716_SCLS1|nr:predicted protein [Sclerotinia sclerotiorum 1980 UF-70]EDN98537.1 predicted protein [Sclerotinia sclerotiorum 1980 UF-70]
MCPKSPKTSSCVSKGTEVHDLPQKFVYVLAQPLIILRVAPYQPQFYSNLDKASFSDHAWALSIVTDIIIS